ncbi:MAG TPA: heparan-alpha-glucosaminide N-acetyltransferase domain-containing protein [Pyrinomonadaceae bacterium]|nr:heparan-alpha-glucosaminide N-acetyltransferase domain-containing protein [Pyrinomonadaceae bacterium]
MSDETLKNRVLAVDCLRGVVMMIMLLDHTRDFVHADALRFDPTDLTQTSVVLFFTRWITHYCAPTFVFLSGVSIYLQKMNGKSNAELSRFLLTRGLWLIFLEFTVVRTSFVFNLDYHFIGAAQVIWVIGVSMIVLAGLIYLPLRLVGIIGILMIVLHNLLDSIRVPPNVAFAGTPPPDISQTLWLILHQQGLIPLFGGASQVFLAYPLIPWIGVMAVGYVCGSIYSWNSEKRRRWLLVVGGIATVFFVVIRLINVYGDPSPWSGQPSAIFTFLSFLNTTKYPPSLLFLLMTLGPALIVLGLTDHIDGKALSQRIAINFGRVPMFYYLLQFAVAHAFAVLLGFLAGKDVSYLFLNFPDIFTKAPPGSGFSLWVAYAAWISGLILLYPLCKWWGNLKRRNKSWVLSYL